MKSRLEGIQDWEKLAKDAGYDPVDMAALCPISLRQLERFFTLRFGISPRRWLRELQCRLAKELIAQGWSNQAVAQELNFANESHLCHAFRENCGNTPQSFAPMHGRDVAHKQECRTETIKRR
jgi:AraC family transcriptional regulator